MSSEKRTKTNHTETSTPRPKQEPKSNPPKNNPTTIKKGSGDFGRGMTIPPAEKPPKVKK